jgi:nuclear migration protein JNM1
LEKQATSATSPTTSSYDDAVESVTEDRSGIDRAKFQPNDARARFRPARVDARNVDFSNRATGTQRSYRTSSRRQRHDYDDREEYGDWSDEEDEDLERKIARLRREVEEVKLEVQQRARAPAEGDGEQEEEPIANIEKISEVLDAFYSARHGGPDGAEADFSKLAAKFDQDLSTQAATTPATKALPSASASLTNPQLAQALQKAGDFDTRLWFLETALGLDNSNLPDHASNPPKPLLHNLQTMAQKIQSLQEPSSTIDAAASKARKAAQDFERLHLFRKTIEDENYSKPAAAELEEARKAEGYIDDAKRITKINALYGTLPTIDSFAPILPTVLERLRTLRALHGAAAAASGTLDEMEKRQNEQAVEIQQWREALLNVEARLKEGKGALTENVENVGEWVKDLESRVKRFG